MVFDTYANKESATIDYNSCKENKVIFNVDLPEKTQKKIPF